MPSCLSNIVQPQILNFQARYASTLNHRRTKLVRPTQEPLQEKMLNEIWHVGRLGESSNNQPGMETVLPNGNGENTSHSAGLVGRSWVGWWKLGLIGDQADDAGGEERAYLLEAELFRDVGELGLECLVSFRCRRAGRQLT
jgi:engulfment/cell motility protein 1